MTMQDEIKQVLLQARDEIRANMAAKDINATGRTSAAMQVRASAQSIELYNAGGQVAPLFTLEIGRTAGNVPGGFRITKAGVRDVSNLFKYILIQWAKAKGFELSWGGATMLGRRIAAEGTLRNKNHVDVYSTPVNVAVQRIKEQSKQSILTQIQRTITTNF